MNSKHITIRIVGVVVAVFIVVPTLIVIPIGFAGTPSFVFPPSSWSLQYYEALWTNPIWRGSFQWSLLIGVLSATIATILGTAVAVGLARWTARRTAASVRTLLLSAIAIPGIVLAIGIYAAFSILGLVGTLLGFLIAHAALGMPYVVISVSVALASLDKSLAPAAAGLGATEWAIARRITIPLIFPGVMAGFLFAFVTSFDEVLISLFIRSPLLTTLPVQMYQSITFETDPTIAAASTFVLVFVTSIMAIGSWLVTRRSQTKSLTKDAE